ncbi:MAG: hypothetical protein U0P30_15415 [Vicinamibacterales bacterium]
MSLPTCVHEADVIRACGRGEWPDQAPAELRAHVSGCAVCRDTIAIASMLRGADAADDAPVPTAAQMWWRLAVRARLDRERAAARPVVWLQGLAAACGLGLVVTAVGAIGPRVGGAMTDAAGRATSLLPSVSVSVPEAASPLLWVAGGVALVAAASAVVVLWLAHD